MAQTSIRLLLGCILASMAGGIPVAEATPSASLPSTEVAGDEVRDIDNYYDVKRLYIDYELRSDGVWTCEELQDTLLKTQSAVDALSEERLSYTDHAETLEVLEAYVIDADGRRHDVSPDRIYEQQADANSHSGMHVDGKVKMIVYPRLAPGTRIVRKIRTTNLKPVFPGHFEIYLGLNLFQQYTDVRIRLAAPASVNMQVHARAFSGGTRSVSKGKAYWEWTYQNRSPLPEQTWGADMQDIGPFVLATTSVSWKALAREYQRKAAVAAAITPAIGALAKRLTEGLDDPHARADALYRWVAKNVRYAAIYLGNGGWEPNPAQDVLDKLYGDCKDMVTLLQALLGATGIDSTQALVSVERKTLAAVPVASQFDHAILYIPSLNTYADPTAANASFGTLPTDVLGKPVLHTADGRLTHTPPVDAALNRLGSTVEYRFDSAGDAKISAVIDFGEIRQIDARQHMASINDQSRAQVVAQIVADQGVDGVATITSDDPYDLGKQIKVYIAIDARAVEDFSRPGAIKLPRMPKVDSMRNLYRNTSSPTNALPFQCDPQTLEETYVLRFPENVRIGALPEGRSYRNAAGEYTSRWERQGQVVTVQQRLLERSVRGMEQLCEPADYLLFRDLYRQVRKGFEPTIAFEPLSSSYAPAP